MGAPGSDGTGTARGREVPSTGDHRTLFPERSPKTLAEGLRRLVREGFLECAARGVSRNPLSRLSTRYLIENTLVLAARPLRIARIEAALRNLRRVGRSFTCDEDRCRAPGVNYMCATGRMSAPRTRKQMILLCHACRRHLVHPPCVQVKLSRNKPSYTNADAIARQSRSPTPARLISACHPSRTVPRIRSNNISASASSSRKRP